MQNYQLPFINFTVPKIPEGIRISLENVLEPKLFLMNIRIFYFRKSLSAEKPRRRPTKFVKRSLQAKKWRDTILPKKLSKKTQCQKAVRLMQKYWENTHQTHMAKIKQRLLLKLGIRLCSTENFSKKPQKFWLKGFENFRNNISGKSHVAENPEESFTVEKRFVYSEHRGVTSMEAIKKKFP